MPISGTTTITAPIAPTSAGDTYASHIAEYGKGGYMAVADNTARDAITTDRRTYGMLVYVIATGIMYTLGPGLTNGDWSVSNRGVQVVSTVASLAALTGASIPNGTEFYVRCFATVGDGGEGYFYYDSGSSATAYTGCVVAPADATGRFLRKIQFGVNPKMCGAVGNFLTGGVGGTSSGTDDTTAFQTMFNFAGVYGHRVIGYPGNYRLTSTITIPTTFGGVVDFGARDGGATKPMNLYMDANAKALFELTKPSGQTWQNIVCYWKPQSGWNVAFNDMSPQVDPLSFMFYIKGWGKYLTIQRCDAWHCAGFITSIQIGAGSGSDQAALFDNTVSDCIVYFGYRGLNLNYGSGSRWSRMRFQTSPGNANGEPGDPPSYHAEHAIVVAASLGVGPGINNELFQNINFEWSSFTKPMIQLVNSEAKFDSIHIEGINLPYNATYGSTRVLILQSGGNIVWEMIRIQNIHMVWGLNRLFALFELYGSPNSYFRLNSAIFETINDNSDDNIGGHTGGYYRLHRYIDNGGGASFMEVDLVNDANVRWESDSPSWYGQDPRALPPSKRFELRTDFADGLSQWSTYYSGSPTEIVYGGESGSVGVATINSGGSDTNGTLLILDKAPIYVSQGTYRFLFRFKLSAMATGAADSYAVRIGFMSDMSAGISSTPADGIFFETKYSIASNDAFYLTTIKSGVGTTRGQWIQSNETDTDVSTADLDTEANQWYEGELVINADGTQTRLLSNPRKSTAWANNTSTIPSSATVLYPQALITKIGAGSNVTLKLDYLYVTYAPNGIY